MKKFEKVISKEIDLAGKVRIMVDVGGGEALMLKFQQDPSQEIVIAKTTEILEKKTQLKIETVEEIDKQIETLQQKKELVVGNITENLKG